VIRIITGANAELTQWIGERLGMALGVGAALGFAEDRPLLRAIHYTNSPHTWATTEMPIYTATPRWADRCTLHDAFSYPFLQVGSRRVGATIVAENRHANLSNASVFGSKALPVTPGKAATRESTT
jgi:hypothetical protein